MKTIKAKIMSAAIVLAVGSQLTTGLFIVSRVEEAMHLANHKLGRALCSELSHVCTLALVSRDLAELRNFVQAALTQPQVRQAMIVDTDCRIIMHNNLEKVGETYAGRCLERSDDHLAKHSFHTEAEEVETDIVEPIELAGVMLGAAVISFSHLSVEEEVKALTRKIILIFGLGSAAAISLAFLFAEYIARPIRHLSRATRELVGGSFKIKKMGDRYNDEIGDLARSFYRMAEKLEKDVCHDALTGLCTRNVFLMRVSEACAYSHRHHRPFGVLMCDVDYFKKVNDTHGHAIGDEVLCHVARILSGQNRGGDCIARYGGEEFLVLLPETDQRGALHVAEKIRGRVEAHPFLLRDGRRIPLTISIGLAIYPDDTREPAALIDLADQALYEAKRAGRNKVVAAARRSA